MDRIPYYLPAGFKRQIRPYLDEGYLTPATADHLIQSGMPWNKIACYVQDLGWWGTQSPKQASEMRQDWEFQSWGATLELHTKRWRVIVDPGELAPTPAISCDVIIVTHVHYDHIAKLLEYSQSDPLTPIIMSSLTADLLAIKNQQPEMHKLLRSQVLRLEFGEECLIRGIKIRLIPAGHLLGAAMCILEADQDRFLITGDFALRDVGGLQGAEILTESFQSIFIESTAADQGTLPTMDEETTRTPILKQVDQACLLGHEQIVIHSQSFGQSQEIYTALALAKWVGAFPNWEIGFTGFPALVAKKYKQKLAQISPSWRVPLLILNDEWIPPKTLLITTPMDIEHNEENSHTTNNTTTQSTYHIYSPNVYTHAGWGERMAFSTGISCHDVYFYHGSRPIALRDELNKIGRTTCFLI